MLPDRRLSSPPRFLYCCLLLYGLLVLCLFSGSASAGISLPKPDGWVSDYADLLDAWGIGKKGKDEGVLLLVAPKERKIRIEVGYGLEGTIPDGLAGEIIRDTITPRFRQGRFGEGIEEGVGRIVETIARQKQLDLTTPRA